MLIWLLKNYVLTKKYSQKQKYVRVVKWLELGLGHNIDVMTNSQIAFLSKAVVNDEFFLINLEKQIDTTLHIKTVSDLRHLV